MPKSNWPSWLEPIPSFSREQLFQVILGEARRAWFETLRGREHETFYAFGLFPEEDDLSLRSVGVSEQALRRLVEEATEDPGTAEERAHRLRWDFDAWPYVVSEPFGETNRLLGELRYVLSEYMNPNLAPSYYEQRWDSQWVPFMKSLGELYMDVLRELDSRGSFVVQPSRVVLGVFGRDAERLQRSIERLNPAHQAERVFREMKRGTE